MTLHSHPVYNHSLPQLIDPPGELLIDYSNDAGFPHNFDRRFLFFTCIRERAPSGDISISRQAANAIGQV